MGKYALRIAMEQSAADIGCKAEDFLSDNTKWNEKKK